MSTKKPASSAAGKSAASSSRKSVVTRRGGSASAAASSQAATARTNAASATSSARGARARVLSHLDIGEVAGEIWHLLARGEAHTLASIKKSISAPGDVVVASVGWLAREDKLNFIASGRTLKVALKS